MPTPSTITSSTVSDGFGEHKAASVANGIAQERTATTCSNANTIASCIKNELGVYRKPPLSAPAPGQCPLAATPAGSA
jgi:hypothetical protein